MRELQGERRSRSFKPCRRHRGDRQRADRAPSATAPPMARAHRVPPRCCWCTKASCRTSMRRWRSAARATGATIRTVLRAGARSLGRDLAGRTCSSPATAPASPVRAAAGLRGELAALAHRRQARPARRGASADRQAQARCDDASAASSPLRPFLDALFTPRRQIFAPADETIVCRCEEITARDIRAMAAVGDTGPQPGQGVHPRRHGAVPGPPVRLHRHAHPRGGARSARPAEVGFYRIRPPLKPVTLGELAVARRAGDGRREPARASDVDRHRRRPARPVGGAASGARRRKVVVLERAWVGPPCVGRHRRRRAHARAAILPRCRSRSRRWTCGIASRRSSATIAAFTRTARSASRRPSEHLATLERARGDDARSSATSHEEIDRSRRAAPARAGASARIASARWSRGATARPIRIARCSRFAAAARRRASRSTKAAASRRSSARGADWLVVAAASEAFTAPVVVNAAGAWAGAHRGAGRRRHRARHEGLDDDRHRAACAAARSGRQRRRPLAVVQADRAQGTLVIGGGLQGSADLDTRAELASTSASLPRARARPRDLFPAVRDVRIARAWTGHGGEDRRPDARSSARRRTRPACSTPSASPATASSSCRSVGAIICDLARAGRHDQRQIAAFAAERLMPRKAAA